MPFICYWMYKKNDTWTAFRYFVHVLTTFADTRVNLKCTFANKNKLFLSFYLIMYSKKSDHLDFLLFIRFCPFLIHFPVFMK